MPLKILTGNYAVAEAVKLARVKVIAAYPITPQTTIVEKLDEMIEKGELDAVMIRVESEHSALAATYGAASGGVRAFTATSSHGLLYMHEVVWWVAGSRIPVVMAIVTRAIGPPWNIWSEHSDILAQRDTGWLICMAENNQEALDLTLQLFKITEDERVFLPGMVGLDGFILSHTAEPVDVPDQKVIDEWLPPRKQPYVYEPGKVFNMGNLPASTKDNALMRYDIQRAMEKAKQVIKEVDKEYGRITGRKYGGLIECYRCEDAKYFVIGMGAWCGDMKEAVDTLRSEGYPVGLLRLRFVRPFPREDLSTYLRSSKGVVVFDRSISFGSVGPLYLDVITHAYIDGIKGMQVKNYIAGIAGMDVSYKDFAKLIKSVVNEVEEKGFIERKVEWVLG